MTREIIILCIAAFAAGFIDAIVGGGGLVQTPATLITLPQYPMASLLGTTKIPSLTGTSIAAFQYAFKVNIRWKLLAAMCSIALVAAYGGSLTVTLVSNAFIKPLFLITLIAVFIYTYTKKDFGLAAERSVSLKKQYSWGMTMALLIGFYDGFIGPGTGSFLILFFISMLGFDFLKASAHAKLVNVSTNIGSILFFSRSGHILYQYAIPMAVCNFTGAVIGARLAILKGNKFIRVFFLLVITVTIIRFGYDIFVKK
jgi:uncharacterized membrane protein YfcA